MQLDFQFKSCLIESQRLTSVLISAMTVVFQQRTFVFAPREQKKINKKFEHVLPTSRMGCFAYKPIKVRSTAYFTLIPEKKRILHGSEA